MLITLMQENRGINFSAFGKPHELPVLGQYRAEDFNADLGYGFSGGTEAEVAVAQVKIRVPFEVAHNTLPLSTFPQMESYYQHRARYASIQSTFYLRKTWLIEGGIIEQIGADMATVTLNLKEPEAWVAKYPSRANTDGKDLVGTRSQLLKRLTESLSMNVPTDGEPFKKLPILPYDPNWKPSAEEEAEGYVQGSTVDDGRILTIPSPDPLSIDGALNEVMANWPDGIGNYGLKLLEDTSYAAPTWRWVLWKHLPEVSYITKADLELFSVEFSNEFTDAMVYNSDNPLEHRYMGGKTIANPGHNGAWLGVDFQSYSKTDPRGSLPRGSRSPNIRRDFNRGNRFPFTRNERGNRVFFTDEGVYSGDGQPMETALTPGSLAMIAREPFGIMFTGKLPPEEPDFNIVLEVFVDGKKTGQIINSAHPNGSIFDVKIKSSFTGHLVEVKPLGDKFVQGWASRFELPAASKFEGEVIALPLESYRAPSGKTLSLEGQFEGNTKLYSVASAEGVIVAVAADEPGYRGISGYCARRFYGCTKLISAPEEAISFPEYTGDLLRDFKEQEYYDVLLSYIPKWNNLPKVRSLGDDFGKDWFMNDNVEQHLNEEWIPAITSGIPPLPAFEGVVEVGDNIMQSFIDADGYLQHDESVRYIFPNLEVTGDNFLANFCSAKMHDMDALYIPLLPSLREVRQDGSGRFMASWAANVNPRPDGSFIDVIDDMPNWVGVENRGGWFWLRFCSKNYAIDRTIKESKLRWTEDWADNQNQFKIISTPAGYLQQMYAFPDTRRGNIRTILPESQNLPLVISSTEYREIYLTHYRDRMYKNALAEDAPRENLTFVENFEVDGWWESLDTRNGTFDGNGFDGTPGNSVFFLNGNEVLAKEDDENSGYKHFYKYTTRGNPEGGEITE